MKITNGISLFLASAAATVAFVEAKAILGVDLGSLYMKVALVQRNAPLEIVTNLHSKRKTENMILFDSGTRFYGADASSLLARKPLKTPSGMSVMLGRHDAHPNVQILAERHYPLTPAYNETRFGTSLSVDGTEFTPEELVAMVLTHAKDITIQSHSQASVKDVVLTVPSFATQHERRALLDAALLADLNVLSLIDENTASALNFGMDKVETEPQVVIFYNMGASALQVSIVRYLSYPHKDSKYAKEKTVGGFEILSKAWDSTLGGLSFDHKLVDFMAEEFNAQLGDGSDVRTNARALTKLRLQANKVKHVLSANTDFPIYIDGLWKDTSYSSHISRAKLEELCHEELERAVKPIHSALERAGLTLDDVHSIEMLGGGMRIPRIQEEILKTLDGKIDVLGMHINSDESMALGAAFHGANISTAFRVRHVGMADVNPFPVSIDLKSLEEEAEEVDGEEGPWSKHATMFKAFGKVGVKKTIAFTHDKDVHCAIDYEEDSETLPSGTELAIERYNITGVEAFAKEMEEKGLGKPKVSLQFELSSSGITQLIKAEAAVEETYTVEEEVEIEEEEEEAKDGEETKEEAAATTESDEKKQEAAAEEEKKEEETTTDDAEATDAEAVKEGDDTEKANETKPEPKKKKTKMVEKEKKRMHKRPLNVVTYHVGQVQPYNDEIMAESSKKLMELAQKDKDRMMLEEARNKVESYIYEIKNKLSDYEDDIAKISTEEQREALRKAAENAEEWMYDDGYNADLPTMEDKYLELSGPAEKVWFRMAEMTARPEAIKELKTKLGKVGDLMTKWETTMPQVTEEERAEVLALVEDVNKWITENEEAQSKADPTAEEPAFVSADVPLQTKSIEKLVSKLSKKPKPKPAKKEENETKSEGDDAANKTSDEENTDDLDEEKKDGDEESSKEETTDDASEEKTEEPVGEEL
mmetsp:Transcript_14708/g.16217  ORF Transcript_14708/g.16217 Transcript_14708/m.16217 type:complete len:932 (-) Transcript_14708:46-2841(-)